MPERARVFILRVRSGDQDPAVRPDLVIREGDTIAVIGAHELHATRGSNIGPEQSDRALLDMPVEAWT